MTINTILEKAAKLADLSPADLRGVEEEALKLLRARGVERPSLSQLLDAVEHIAMILGIVDDKWALFAKYTLLMRIYVEAGKQLEKPAGVEERLSYQAIRLLYTRYLLRNEEGKVRETPDELFKRVANYVALAEARYGNPVEDYTKKFYTLMAELKFLPNSPTLMNAATRRPQLAACFVVPLDDDINAILDALRVTVHIHRTGAGVGFDFSPLRPRGDIIKGTGGLSSGPVSFMRLFDVAADVIKEGGKRRGAMMGIMHDWHPDIIEFIRAKCGQVRVFENFNISVAVHDEFIRAVLEDGEWSLYNPRTCPNITSMDSLEEARKQCKPWRTVKARKVFEEIVKCAWTSGDPGLVFVDTINKHNPTPGLGVIHATNPCGETPLLDWEACNLGSINLHAFVKGGQIQWRELEETVRLAVRFLDDVIDMSWYPDPRIEEAVLRTRKIGLGVMGLADALVELGIRYDSDDALFVADKIMEFIAYVARDESNKLARERGPYPAFPESIHAKGRFNFEPQIPANTIYDERKVSSRTKRLIEDRPSLDWEKVRSEMIKGTRNATVTTIAPTGSISIIANVNSSIEPYFALVYIRETTVGLFVEVNQHLRRILKQRGKLTREVLIEIAKGNKVYIPAEYRSLLRTAHEIGPEWHIKMQAVFQRWTDNAVSKTINMRHDATIEDVHKAFILAWKLGCKGITVFRDRSKPEQVIKVGKTIEEVLKSMPEKLVHKDKLYHRWLRIGKDELVMAAEEYAGGCPTCEI